MRKVAVSAAGRVLVVALMLAGVAIPAAWAQDYTGDTGKPLWEIEALAIGGYEPDYPGSNQMHAHVLPVPWFVYRGKFLRTDDRGEVEGLLLQSRRFTFDISAKVSFPSEANDLARTGMPQLQYLGEVGPRAKLGLYYWQNAATGRLATLQLEVPVRAAISSDLTSFAYRGFDSQPALAFVDSRFLNTPARWKLSVGPIFASQGLMNYYYAVPVQYATALRPAYAARAGYMAGDVHTSLEFPIFDRINILGSVDYYALNGASNAASPLMTAKSNISFMTAVSVSLYQSSERATYERGN